MISALRVFKVFQTIRPGIEKVKKAGNLTHGMVKILVVEDSEVEKGIIVEMLKSLQYEDVLQAKDYDEAMAYIKADTPDLVILDVLMPKKDGLDTLAEIKKENPDIKVIMLTSLDQEKVKRYAENLGAGAYLLKPFEPTVLDRTISEVMNK